MSINRRAELEAAEAKGMAMFDAIERAGLLAPGRSEIEVTQDIELLAERDFGVKRHWHKRLVRTGPNTVCTYYDEPPLRVIAPEDTVYLDRGTVKDEWEADIGRSSAMGGDPDKQRLIADLPRVFERVKAHYAATPDITGEALCRFAQRAAEDAGWLFGNNSAGHIVGEFPHAKRVPGTDRTQHSIKPGNAKRMRDPDAEGHARNWILEIHLVDPTKSWGGFYERLL
mgnify:FL=1